MDSPGSPDPSDSRVETLYPQVVSPGASAISTDKSWIIKLEEYEWTPLVVFHGEGPKKNKKGDIKEWNRKLLVEVVNVAGIGKRDVILDNSQHRVEGKEPLLGLYFVHALLAERYLSITRGIKHTHASKLYGTNALHLYTDAGHKTGEGPERDDQAISFEFERAPYLPSLHSALRYKFTHFDAAIYKMSVNTAIKPGGVLVHYVTIFFERPAIRVELQGLLKRDEEYVEDLRNPCGIFVKVAKYTESDHRPKVTDIPSWIQEFDLLAQRIGWTSAGFIEERWKPVVGGWVGEAETPLVVFELMNNWGGADEDVTAEFDIVYATLFETHGRIRYSADGAAEFEIASTYRSNFDEGVNTGEKRKIKEYDDEDGDVMEDASMGGGAGFAGMDVVIGGSSTGNSAGSSSSSPKYDPLKTRGRASTSSHHRASSSSSVESTGTIKGGDGASRGGENADIGQGRSGEGGKRRRRTDRDVTPTALDVPAHFLGSTRNPAGTSSSSSRPNDTTANADAELTATTRYSDLFTRKAHEE